MKINLFIILGVIIVVGTISCKISKTNSMENNDKADIDSSEVSIYNLEDSIHIVLENNLQGGYEWFYRDDNCFNVLDVIDSSQLNTSTNLYEYNREYILQAKDTGIFTLVFDKKRAFEPDSLALLNEYTQKIKIQ
ncbi:MAG: protease inhibitor I42 family protein [Chitinophagales bacterium]|nr:protease inhibitor I42 family protein [Chitinophagales bacterium]